MHLRSNLIRKALMGSGLLGLFVNGGAGLWGQVDLSAWPQVRVEVMAVDPDGRRMRGPRDPLVSVFRS